MTDDFYDLLEIPSDASQDEIKEAYREKVQVYHPDVNDDDRARSQFTAVKKAYDILGDPVERQAYDRLGHEDYVAKRTSGIPSPDVWSSGDSGSSQSTDGSTTETSRSPGSTANSGAGSSTSSRSTTGARSRTGSATGTSSGVADDSNASGTDTSHTTSGSGSTARSSSTTSSTSETTSAGRSPSGSGTASTSSGAGTATGTGGDTHAGTGAGTATASSDGGTATGAESPGGAGTGMGTRSRNAGRSGTGSGTGTSTGDAVFRWWRRRNFSLPLIWTSLLVYLAGIVQFALANENALQAVVADIVALGADPEAVWTHLTVSRHGVDTISGFVVGLEPVAPPAGLESPQWYAAVAGIVGLAVAAVAVDRLVRREETWETISIDETILFALAIGTATALVGGPLLAGAALMPFLFAVIVHRTRLGRGWKPSYLYVVPVLAPAAGVVVGLSGVVGEVTLLVDLLAYVLLPLAGALGLPLRATIRKHFDR